MILELITLLHFIVILFVVLVPFSSSKNLLILHFIIVPFIALHWVFNNNACCLTLLEKSIMEHASGKKVKMNECMTYKLIAPIYDFNDNNKEFEMFTYSVTLILWMITGYKLYYEKYYKGACSCKGKGACKDKRPNKI